MKKIEIGSQVHDYKNNRGVQVIDVIQNGYVVRYDDESGALIYALTLEDIKKPHPSQIDKVSREAEKEQQELDLAIEATNRFVDDLNKIKEVIK